MSQLIAPAELVGMNEQELRALHARDRAGRARARRPLVVGNRRQEGVRAAPAPQLK